MQAIKCPQCGAPAQIESAVPTHTCTFCRVSFQLAPSAAGVQQQQQNQCNPNQDDDEHDHEHVEQPSVALEAGRAAGRAVGPFIIVGGIIALTTVLGGGYAFSGLGLLGTGWDGSKPFSCDSNQQVHAKDVTATFSSGSAVTIDGNCHFECESCTIKAPIAATVRGNGRAVFVNGSIDAVEAIADVGNNGRFEVRGNTQVKGGKPRKTSNAEVVGLPSAAPAPAVATPPPAAAPGAPPAAAPATPKATTKPVRR